MTVFRHEVTLAGCTREWFDQFVAEAHSAAESLRFEDGRLAGAPSGDPADGPGTVSLVAGRHAARGARYQVGPAADGTSFTVTDWDRARRTGIALRERSGGHEMTAEVRLRSASRPRDIEARGGYRDPGGHWLARRADWSAEVSLAGWWKRLGTGSGTGTGAGAAPAAATVSHPLVRARTRAVPRPAGSAGGQPRWAVEVVTTVRGRRWARPLVAVVLVLARASIQDTYRKTLDEIASRASPGIATAAGMSPREAVAAMFAAGPGNPGRDT